MECKEYVDKVIKEKTTYIDAKSFIEGAKPLRKMWTIIGIVIAVAMAVNVGVGIVCLVVAMMVPMLITTFLNLKENAKKYSMGENHEIDLDNLCDFLSKNLGELSFGEWQRGKPSSFGVVTEELDIIECCFKGKTYHRIIFDKTRNGQYQIASTHISKKERLKRMSRGNTLLYKHHYVVTPILKAALDFYFSKEDM